MRYYVAIDDKGYPHFTNTLQEFFDCVKDLPSFNFKIIANSSEYHCSNYEVKVKETFKGTKEEAMKNYPNALNYMEVIDNETKEISTILTLIETKVANIFLGEILYDSQFQESIENDSVNSDAIRDYLSEAKDQIDYALDNLK